MWLARQVVMSSGIRVPHLSQDSLQFKEAVSKLIRGVAGSDQREGPVPRLQGHPLRS